MSSDIISQPLVQLVRELRSGELRPEIYLEQLEANFEEREPDILAFLPEKDRFARLISEAAGLVASYPDPLVLRGREARSVRLLKEAGALIMGKTVTTEFAYYAPGPTRNPHNLEHTPGGSSSGSAAAIAARLCPVTTGTQTIGSVIRPASYCGITGFKPSYDRVSRSGIVPLSPSLDHFGLFTNEISGVDLVANVLCPDWQIAVAERLPALGIPEGPYLAYTSAEGMGFFRETCDRLIRSGYDVKSVEILADFEEIAARHRKILAAETAQVHADWYPEFGHLYDKRTCELIEEGFSITVGELAEALTGFGVDLWISPSAVGPADHGPTSTGDPIMNLPWTHAGLPVISLPASISEAGLPLGLQLAGRWYGDEVLLEWGVDLERILVKKRKITGDLKDIKIDITG
jgi:Asp-tRNA(Asn)/Glu-tRNA(Gln) amidotransferase A subunit family amidase